MPGQEHLAARARVAESVMPDGPEFARPAGAPAATSSGPEDGTGAPPSRSLASRTNRPAVAASSAEFAEQVAVPDQAWCIPRERRARHRNTAVL